ncbi:MAG TPA: His-Xaa-Ser system protein HxsD [Methylophilaceae bacterium]|nr:His-Xaa-Ser system protein HxsD [Methylophilaceae bacterium]
MSVTTLTFDERIYPVDALQKAAYRFMNLFVVDFSIDKNLIICSLKPTQNSSQEGMDYHIDEFKKEVLDQVLRLKIKAETEDVRNLILGIAFSKSGFQ